LLELSGIPFYEASFSGRKSPPNRINSFTNPTKPSSAPFKEVMELSTFLLELTRMIAEVYGPYPLVAGLKDDNLNVRAKSLLVLNELGQAATPALISALMDPDVAVQAEAANILEALGEPAVDTLISALEDKRAHVRLNVEGLMFG
jgi:HEAT repeat protein